MLLEEEPGEAGWGWGWGRRGGEKEGGGREGERGREGVRLMRGEEMEVIIVSGKMVLHHLPDVFYRRYIPYPKPCAVDCLEP